MSIFSTECCPKCKDGFLGFSTAFLYQKIRFDCSSDCGYSKEIRIDKTQCIILMEILKQK